MTYRLGGSGRRGLKPQVGTARLKYTSPTRDRTAMMAAGKDRHKIMLYTPNSAPVRCMIMSALANNHIFRVAGSSWVGRSPRLERDLTTLSYGSLKLRKWYSTLMNQ